MFGVLICFGRDALQINTLGTLRMFELGKKCKNFVVFHHISTAYVGCKVSAHNIFLETLHREEII